MNIYENLRKQNKGYQSARLNLAYTAKQELPQFRNGSSIKVFSIERLSNISSSSAKEFVFRNRRGF